MSTTLRSSNKAIGPNNQTRHVPEDVARRVWIAAAGRCTICRKDLTRETITGQDVLIGQLAHIVGWSKADGSPRGRLSSLPEHQRNTFENLMLLCHDQHKAIDTRSLWAVYDEDTLRRLKRTHEDTMRRLTGLSSVNQSTVLRVVGDVGSVPISLSQNAIARYLLERDRFPDYALLGVGEELEVDLRGSAGQKLGTHIYWAWAADQIAALGDRLRAQVQRGLVDRVSVVAIGRIPVLVALGATLAEGLPVELYPARRVGDGGFGWTDDIPTATFGWRTIRTGEPLQPPSIIFSISGQVALDDVQPHIADTASIYEVRVTSGPPGTEVICNQHSIDNLTRCWRDLLGHIERVHDRTQPIDIFPAVPVVGAITIGRPLTRGAQPPLRVFDRNGFTCQFEFALEVGCRRPKPLEERSATEPHGT